MTLGEYLTILDWTGRQVRGDKRGRIPGTLQPILHRLGFEDSDAWLESMAGYRKSLQRVYSAPVNQPVEAARCLVETPSGLRSIPESLV